MATFEAFRLRRIFPLGSSSMFIPYLFILIMVFTSISGVPFPISSPTSLVFISRIIFYPFLFSLFSFVVLILFWIGVFVIFELSPFPGLFLSIWSSSFFWVFWLWNSRRREDSIYLWKVFPRGFSHNSPYENIYNVTMDYFMKFTPWIFFKWFSNLSTRKEVLEVFWKIRYIFMLPNFTIAIIYILDCNHPFPMKLIIISKDLAYHI